jgi:hypothetical protein
MMHTESPRARLSEAQVITIFQAKTTASAAVKVAAVYGVCEKAIRDIWKGRTWARVTWHLDTSRPLQLKQTGRPKGCRDRKPRKKRADSREEQLTSTGSTAQSPCRQHTVTDRHEVVEQVAFPLPQKQHANLGTAAQSPRAALWISQTASVDEQLHAWDEFWRGSTSKDPFCGDWKSY